MKKKTILIVTHSADNECVETVSRHIENDGATAIRFNVDQYPLQTGLTTIYEKGKWSVWLEMEDATVNLEELNAVWFRRSFNLGGRLQEKLQKEYLEAAIGEVKRTVYGMLEGLDCFQLEKYSTYRRLDSKEEQLKLALANGLLIPDTCISNSPERVAGFIKERNDQEVIVKMQSSFTIQRNEADHVVFTNTISADDTAAIEGIRYCPMTFQQRISKKVELRVTIVGDAVFAFSIDSNRKSGAAVDWRREGIEMINDWKPFQLPIPIQERLLSFMDACGLNYGAIDLIVTDQDQYYFLEVNAAGEYFWLDRLCNESISRQIANLLTGTAKRRQTINQPINKKALFL